MRVRLRWSLCVKTRLVSDLEDPSTLGGVENIDPSAIREVTVCLASNWAAPIH